MAKVDDGGPAFPFTVTHGAEIITVYERLVKAQDDYIQDLKNETHRLRKALADAMLDTRKPKK